MRQVPILPKWTVAAVRRYVRVTASVLVLLSAFVVIPPGTAVVGPLAAQAQPPQPPQPTPAPDRVTSPDLTLGQWRTSTDRAVTASGDETGYHLLVADERDAYRWRTAATLAEPGWLTDKWIGQFCLTASGRRAIVVYAPRQFSNRPELMDRGGYAAVVDLATGGVVKLGPGASLAYYNPGCGADETAVVSRLQQRGAQAETWLGVVNAMTGKLTRQATAPGQVTSAAPYRGGVVAARGSALVSFDTAGRESTLAGTRGTAFRLHPDAAGGLAFQTADDATVRFHRLTGTGVSDVGSAPKGSVKLRPGAGGRVFLAGLQATSRLPKTLAGGWQAIDTAPDSDLSTTGRLAVSVSTTRTTAGSRPVAPISDGAPDAVDIDARTSTGARIEFRVRPQPRADQRAAAPPTSLRPSSPRRNQPQDGIPPYDFSDVAYEPDRLCGISRNDPTIQVYQPAFQQVEWAANLAVRNKLTFGRPANWSNNGLPAYSPQGLFPSLPLAGGGTVPAQVMLGILAQESNLWQASWHAVDGSAGNPLTSLGYYGLNLEHPSFLDIPWHDPDPKVDCGYGVAQVTTGMRLDERGRSIDGLTITDLHQKAVALDYATNIAAGLRLLQSKWNQTRNGGLIANNGDPQYIENWWFAIWAYNTGYYPYEDRDTNAGAWGVGWANNPANPQYPPDRRMFLTAPLDIPGVVDDDIGYDNAKHPNHWSYPERVMGWAYTSLIRVDYRAGDFGPTYRTALAGIDRYRAQPPFGSFCAPQGFYEGGNECRPDLPQGPCTRPDLHCWWHHPKAWTDCAIDCGREILRYANVEPRPLYDTIYPSQCSLAGLPAGARIIDDLDVTQKTGPGGCTPNWTRGGRFSLRFDQHVRDGHTIYPSKVDFHQIGGGFGGHFWFAHSRNFTDPRHTALKVTGTWTVDPTNAWTRVFVHVPDHGAHTGQADYRVYLPGQMTTTRHRTIPTRWEKHTWIDLGVFDFRGGGNPRIELSNHTPGGTGVADVAWDAVAVQPLPSKPRHFVVGLGDSYASGEGAGDYTRVSDQYGDDDRRNSCRRGRNAWVRQIRLENSPATLGQLDDSFDPQLDFQFIACSGARTHNVMRTVDSFGDPAPANRSGALPGGSRKEVSQLDAGFLDENTTLVTLTIGGNDAGWADILWTCLRESVCPSTRPGGGSQTLRDIVEDRIRTKVKPDIQRSINEIRQLAPNALIALAGYPQLAATGTSLSLPVEWPPMSGELTYYGLDIHEVAFMNGTAALLATEVLDGITDSRIVKVDVRQRFNGHELMATGLWWINSYVPGDATVDEDGDPVQPSSMESMHPNVYGNLAYADEMYLWLAVNGYVW